MNKKDENYWKKNLTSEQYRVLREAATERAFSGELLHNKETGMYLCAACKTVLFDSKSKFDSGSGWPSFDDVVSQAHVRLVEDLSHGMTRTEVRCANCDSHLGHLFEDGPKQTTALRYCINSAALDFEKASSKSQK